MSEAITAILTENEWEIIKLGREMKTRTGHGDLHVEYRGGIEVLFEPKPRILPPERPRPVR